MARIRSIHPDACENEKLVPLTAEAERTLWRLLTHADDAGRGIDNPKLLAAKLYPLHDDQEADEVDAQLDELVKAGMLVRYVVEGRRYFEIHDFTDWQKPKRPTPSKFPPVEDGVLYSPHSGEHLTHTSPTCSPEPDGDGEHGTPGVEGRGSGEGGGVETEPNGSGGKPPSTEVPGFELPFPTRPDDEPMYLRLRIWATGSGFERPADRAPSVQWQWLMSIVDEILGDGKYSHGVRVSLCGEFAEYVTDKTPEHDAWQHLRQLVKLHGGPQTLTWLGEACRWGAGNGKWANDPLGLTRYVAGIAAKAAA